MVRSSISPGSEEPTSCPQAWKGGCRDWQQKQLVAFADRFYTVLECHRRCQERSACGGWLLRHSSQARSCHLFRGIIDPKWRDP